MSIYPRPKIRFDPAAGTSSAVEASLESDGSIRIVSNPDELHLCSAWLAPAEAREFGLELIGLADASVTIHYDDPPPDRIP